MNALAHIPRPPNEPVTTYDKAGSIYNLLRWISVRTLKECFNTPRDFRYPFMAEE